ncbi:MAG: translation initiation factor IF-2 [Dissulfuribacterales bacterium]
MSEKKAKRLSKIAREFNVGIATITEFLTSKGIEIESSPNAKIDPEIYDILAKEYVSDIDMKKESEKVNLNDLTNKKKSVSISDMEGEDEGRSELVNLDENEVAKEEDKIEIEVPESKGPKVVGKIDLEKKPKKKEEETPAEEEVSEPEDISAEEEIVASAPEEEGSVDPEEQEEIEAEEPEKEEEDKEEIPSETPKKSSELKVVGKIDLASLNQKTRPTKKTKAEREAERKEKRKQEQDQIRKRREDSQEPKKVVQPKKVARKEEDYIETNVKKIDGPNVVGKIDLPKEGVDSDRPKKKRKRIKKEKPKVSLDEDRVRPTVTKKKNKRRVRNEISDEDVDQQLKDTLAKLTNKTKGKSARYRREKREERKLEQQQEIEKKAEEKKKIQVTEFVSVSELANMMEVPVTDVISSCMSLGLMVSINQRLDAETISLVAEEFDYEVEFTSVEVQEAIHEEEDKPEDLEMRAPVITVMGHVDHGKTKLLDYIRHTNVIGGEAGGITQHIGAYNVTLKDGKKITFLDTPGHEAFTAMRARGAQVTDLAIIVVAADDGVKPQTVEAINHASAAGVPIIFAINKIDKSAANPERVKEELANMNYLVEDWGGKYQSQEISAKGGLNIEELLEKVMLEAELLDLKANPTRKASGTIVESTLDKGRGYVATVLVQTGTLRIGDVMLAGAHFGRVKAMYNERNVEIKEAGPSMPALILGVDGAPQAGDKFNIMDSDKEAREIATKRLQLQREQGLRAQKHITLDEIGRRIAIGNFQELNVIVKGDVDGSVEALSDSIVKLSTEEIQVNIIHKGVGQISESDVLLAAASNAIVIGFQVRPSLTAKRLAEKEEIDIRLYSIIYDAIEEIRSAMEGMLSPEIKETIVANLEVQEVFKITKVGTVAGCICRDGKIKRDTKVRVIRDGIVVYSGNLGSLKRFKDDVKEVVSGQDCGLNIENYNDIKVGDIIEGYTEFEVKKKL